MGSISADNAGGEVETQLVTKSSFIQGLCGNKLKQDAKPRIYFVSHDAMNSHSGIPSIQVIFEQCFAERREEDSVVMCSSLEDARIAKSALENLCKPSKLYIPYLREEYPSSSDKKRLLKVLESDTNIVLVSDYRSFRGCEASHSIIFVDYEKPNIMAEMLSRTMADLDIIISLKHSATHLISNPIQTSIKTWERRGWVESTTVHSKEDEENKSIITITLRDSNLNEDKEIEVEKPLISIAILGGDPKSRNYL